MVAVTVALVALKPRDDDERTIHPDDPHDVAQDILAAPLHERFLEPLREAVIDGGGEVLPIEAIVAAGHQELLGPDQSDRVEELRPNSVVARLAARQRQQRDARASPPAQLRQHAAVLVVGVRGRVHRARGRLQFQELLPGAGRALVGGQRIGRAHEWGRGECGSDDCEAPSNETMHEFLFRYVVTVRPWR